MVIAALDLNQVIIINGGDKAKVQELKVYDLLAVYACYNCVHIL